MDRRELRYLLHLWREGTESWRASLRDTADGELRQFSGLDEMVRFLEVQAETAEAGERR